MDEKDLSSENKNYLLVSGAIRSRPSFKGKRKSNPKEFFPQNFETVSIQPEKLKSNSFSKNLEQTPMVQSNDNLDIGARIRSRTMAARGPGCLSMGAADLKDILKTRRSLRNSNNPNSTTPGAPNNTTTRGDSPLENKNLDIASKPENLNSNTEYKLPRRREQITTKYDDQQKSSSPSAASTLPNNTVSSGIDFESIRDRMRNRSHTIASKIAIKRNKSPFKSSSPIHATEENINNSFVESSKNKQSSTVGEISSMFERKNSNSEAQLKNSPVKRSIKPIEKDDSVQSSENQVESIPKEKQTHKVDKTSCIEVQELSNVDNSLTKPKDSTNTDNLLNNEEVLTTPASDELPVPDERVNMQSKICEAADETIINVSLDQVKDEKFDAITSPIKTENVICESAIQTQSGKDMDNMSTSQKNFETEKEKSENTEVIELSPSIEITLKNQEEKEYQTEVKKIDNEEIVKDLDVGQKDDIQECLKNDADEIVNEKLITTAENRSIASPTHLKSTDSKITVRDTEKKILTPVENKRRARLERKKSLVEEKTALFESRSTERRYTTSDVLNKYRRRNTELGQNYLNRIENNRKPDSFSPKIKLNSKDGKLGNLISRFEAGNNVSRSPEKSNSFLKIKTDVKSKIPIFDNRPTTKVNKEKKDKSS